MTEDVPQLPPTSRFDRIIALGGSFVDWLKSDDGHKAVLMAGLLCTAITGWINSCESHRQGVQMDQNTAQIAAVHQDVKDGKDIQVKDVAMQVRGTPSDVAALKAVVTSTSQPSK